ncbi:MAG: glycosyltransferase [Bacteroidales bacterium]|jgi:glycosyltransferase involved in cell wall biosynthesis
MSGLYRKKLLILGKIPPPIGGVTVHVQRLLYSLDKRIDYEFKVLNIKTLMKLFFIANNYKIIHIHSSNPWVRLYVVIVCKLFNIKSINTIHGDLVRFRSNVKNRVDIAAIRLSDKPILLNKGSYEVAKLINNNSEIISAFIPPTIMDNNFMTSDIIKSIQTLKSSSEYVFCTNATNLSYDKKNKEIYGIFELIEVFKSFPSYGLVFSDPSGIYSQTFHENSFNVSSNVLIINKKHSFYTVMKFCDASIRNTTTDGDSLSVKESLYLNLYTFTTDVVSRPKGCILYKKGEFADLLKQEIPRIMKNPIPQNHVVNGAERLVDLYKELMEF